LDSVTYFGLPRTQRDLKSFLGLVNYFRDHMRDASGLMAPLHELVHDYHPAREVKWGESTLHSFDEVKRAIDECPMLHFLDDESEIVLQTDACNTGMGAYLFQRRGNE
jgi:hypothetical protein